MIPRNLYIHFPFCRQKCSYCVLYSRVGVAAADRAQYVHRLVEELASCVPASHVFKTIYFGGGTPALCNLSAFAPIIQRHFKSTGEFTVELHPLDVTPILLEQLKNLGVNRISMGVQSLDDDILRSMNRGYTVNEARRAFARIKDVFDNAGIDLIVGYPNDVTRNFEELSSWGLRHCSVYSLQNERKLQNVLDDDFVLDRIHELSAFLRALGLERYEISNYAVPGFECQHNLAVWRGEDYLGLGDGAFGRIGQIRTPSNERVSAEADRKERLLFRLRTREGLDSRADPQWLPTLLNFTREGLLTREGPIFRLTERGTEVCDSILADLI